MGYAFAGALQGRFMQSVIHRGAVSRKQAARSLRSGLCLGLLLAWGGWIGAQAQTDTRAAPKTLQLCYERLDIHPWRTVDGRGLNFELIRMAAAKAGVTVQFVTLPWKRCLSEMQEGVMHGVFAASFAPDRLAMGAYPGGNPPDPALQLYSDGYVLVRRKNDAVQWDGKNVTGLTGPVGAQVGYSVANDLRRLGVAVDEGSQTARELLQKLQLGRLGAAALGNSDALNLLGDRARAGEFGANLEVLPQPLMQKAYYLMLSNQLVQQAPDLADRLWRQIGAVRRSPDYQKLQQDVAAGRKP